MAECIAMETLCSPSGLPSGRPVSMGLHIEPQNSFITVCDVNTTTCADTATSGDRANNDGIVTKAKRFSTAQIEPLTHQGKLGGDQRVGTIFPQQHCGVRTALLEVMAE